MAKHEYHWTFGDHCHIRFPNGGAPVVENDHAFKTDEGCATISDSGGNRLFGTDGVKLYNANDIQVTAPDLGGSWSSSHSAIIVPPAGGGSRYHIFTMRAWDIGPHGPLSHSTVGVSGTVALLSGPTQLTTLGPPLASERLAAVPHRDCGKYWVIAMDGGIPPKIIITSPIEVGGGEVGKTPNDIKAPGKTQAAGTPPPPPPPGNLYAILVDSDSAPTTQKVTPYPFPISAAYCCKISPDGSMFAVASDHTVDLLRFDRATGVFTGHAQLTGFSGTDRAYGVEFSPNGRYLYVSVLQSGQIYRHDVALPGPTPKGSLPLVGTTTTLVHSKYRVGALQLGPNGKIYGVKVLQPTLLEIADPDNVSPNSVQFSVDAVKAGGGKLQLHKNGILGLPTFTRITPDCDDNCRNLAAAVDQQLAATPKVNALRPCNKSRPVEKPPCAPLDLPRIAPWTSIRWGDSKCDCIEGDDTEVMHLTVCNPYRNLTLSNLTIHQLLAVDLNGNPPPLLPDGSPSIQLVPVGPYCFDDLAPCTCVTRQFVLRLRGAVPGPYRILVRGICFDACFHGDEQNCFIFEVCKD